MNPKSSTAPQAKSITYFDKEVLVLKICGISLTGDEGVGYRVYSFIVLSCTVFAYFLLDTYEMFKHDFQTASDIFSYDIAVLLTLIDSVVIFRNRVKMGKLLIKLEHGLFVLNPEQGDHLEEKLINECFWLTKIQRLVYWSSTSSVMFAGVVSTAIIRMTSSDYHDWKFPYAPLTFLNVTYSPNYEICWCYQNISVIVLINMITSISLILCGVLTHVCYHFKILQNSFRRIVNDSYEDMMEARSENALPGPSTYELSTNPSSISWTYLQKYLKNVVRYHLAILDLANEVEEIFSGLALSTFLATLCLLCFFVYNVSAVDNNFQALTKILAVVCVSWNVLVLCYWGEQLQHESEQVGRAAYETNFVGTDLRFQKALVLIINRSQNPCQLTAGKFTVASLATFAWILRTSYSALMTLRGINTNKI